MGKKLKLSEISDVVQGNILTRIKPSSKFDETIEFDSISMQELSYVVGQSDILEDKKKVKVLKSKINSCILTKQKDVVVCLNTAKALVVDEKSSNNLLLSNFILIRIFDNSVLDPNYFCWLFNEDLQLQKCLHQKKQKNANVSVFATKEIRDIELTLPSIDKQRIIGEIYELGRKRDRISKTIIQKTSNLRKYLLNKFNQNKGE